MKRQGVPVLLVLVLVAAAGGGGWYIGWRQGVDSIQPRTLDKPAVTSPDLAAARKRLMNLLGKKTTFPLPDAAIVIDKSDKKLDQAIIHADNRLPFKQVIAVLDALYSRQRELAFSGGKVKKVPVFNMTFSVR